MPFVTPEQWEYRRYGPCGTASFGKKTITEEEWCTTKTKTKKNKQKNSLAGGIVKTSNKISIPVGHRSYRVESEMREQTRKNNKVAMIEQQLNRTKNRKKQSILDQIREEQEKKMDEEIQCAFDILELNGLCEETQMMFYITAAENDSYIHSQIKTVRDNKDADFLQCYVRNYSMGTYLDLEHFSDKGWYVECPCCKCSIYESVDDPTCSCNPVLVRGQLYYPIRDIPSE